MAHSREMKTRRVAIELTAKGAHADSRRDSKATFVAQGATASLIACVLPLLLAHTMTQAVFAITVICSIACAAVMSVVAAVRERSERSPLIALCVSACAFAAILAIPQARESLFCLVNGAVSRYDDVFGMYAPLVANTGLVAGDAVFAVFAGLLSGALSHIVSTLRASGATLLTLLLVCGASLRLSLGFGIAGCCCSVAGWLMQCRLLQLHRSSYSLGTLAVSIGAGAVGCIAIFALCTGLYAPIPAISEGYASVRQSIDQMRFGSDSLPEGNLSAAPLMNEGEGELDITIAGPVSDDMLLRGFVGATFENGTWSALDHTAYEGEWAGMMRWLRESGLTPAFQRADFDDASETDTPAQTTSVDVDASKANSKYSYVPYTLSSIEGTSASLDIDGALQNPYFGSKNYRFTMDDVAQGDTIADASWLAASNAPYAAAESVYAAFVRDKYLAIDGAEAQAVKSFIFDDATWDDVASASQYAVISRVRTMLNVLASYTTSPEAPSPDEPFSQWFFGEARAGNSAYFATASVLAFRSQGIPARYVEGYRASRTVAVEAAVSGNALQLTSQDAHAWVEVYLDGIGWTPIEVTPGFYTQALEADQIINVDDARSNGTHEDILQSGSVAGQINDSTDNGGNDEAPDAATIALHTVITLAVLAALAIAAAFAQRVIRISLRKKRIEDDDQSVSVPALFRYLSLVMKRSAVDFDERKPLECADALTGAFSTIDTLEYRRVIELHQAFAFGERTLRPNEMRTLRRFTERLHGELARPTSLAGRLGCYFKDAL